MRSGGMRSGGMRCAFPPYSSSLPAGDDLQRARLIPALLRGGGLDAVAEPAQAAVDPQLGQLLLRAILRQAAAQRREIDPVDVLVLVEARKDHRLGAARRVVMALQALCANLFHHALHR